MALTQFEKDYIRDMVGPLGQGSPDFETATQGTEAERKTMIAAHIAADGSLEDRKSVV